MPQWRTVVNLLQNGAGIFLPKIFNGFEDEKKKTPRYVHLGGGRVHIKNSLKKVGVSYKLEPSLLK